MQFASDANAWSHPAFYFGNTLPYSKCGTTYILGGYKVLNSTGLLTAGGHYFNRTYVNLPSHIRIHFSFQLWMVDSWDLPDNVVIMFDSKKFNGWNMGTPALGKSNICGGAWNDFVPITVSGTVSHTSPSLTVSIISLANEKTDNEALGFRDINLLFATNSTLSADNICGNGLSPLPKQQCPCPDGQYTNGTTCVACHASCITCYGPSAKECYKCKEGYSFTGVMCFICNPLCYSCTGSSPTECDSCKAGYSLFKNTTCVLSNACMYPFSKTGSNTYCESPCTATDYVYWDQSCSSVCNPPLISEILSGVLKYCRYPCNTEEYLYWNGSCKPACPSPLISKTEGGKLFCNLPCDPSEYLHIDGSCSPISCQAPLQHVMLLDAVNACLRLCSNSQHYLYWNDSCLPTCPSPPLIPHSQLGIQSCYLPCDNEDFYYWHGICLPECEFPLIQSTQYGARLCGFPCLPDQYLYWNGTCSNSCDLYYTRRILGNRHFCYPYCPLDKVLFIESTICLDTCPEGFFVNDVTKFCHKCEVSSCQKCSAESPGKCLECEAEMILDANACRRCEILKMSYVRSISRGHEYKLHLFPSSCDLDEKTIQENLIITNETLKDFPPYSFEVIKLRKNFYTVNLILANSILEDKNLNVGLAHLNDSIKVPKKLVSGPILENIAQYSKTAQITLLAIMGASFVGTLAAGATSILWSLISFQQFVGYFIYINVEYPYHAILFLSLFQSISWDFLPNPLASLTSRWSKDILNKNDDLTEQYLPPQKFVDHEVSSFFIENAGTIIVVNISLFLVLYLLEFLRNIGCLMKNKILSIITFNLRWNIIARVFLENGIPLALGVFLQLRCLTFENTYLAICAICTALAAFNLLIMSLFLMIVLENHNSILDSKIMRKIYGTLFEGMTLAHTCGKYYHMIILFRGILLMALLAFFEHVSLVQSSVIIYYNAGLIYFLFAKAKFEDITLNRINRIKEILILFGEICILFMQFHVRYEEYYDIFGWLMVSSLSLALIIELSYMLIVQVMQIKKILRRILEFLKNLYKLLKANEKSL